MILFALGDTHTHTQFFMWVCLPKTKCVFDLDLLTTTVKQLSFQTFWDSSLIDTPLFPSGNTSVTMCQSVIQLRGQGTRGPQVQQR